MPTRVLRPLLVLFLALNTASAATKFKVLHAFAGGTDAAFPTNPLLYRSGSLFGTSPQGGGSPGCSSDGCGAVFELLQSNGHWTENTLYSFSTATDVSPQPVGTLATDSEGNVYGTQAVGGDPSCKCGAVYQLTQRGGVWTLNFLHSFVGGAYDGAGPSSGLVQDAAGNLYGTTGIGGANDNGTIFELTPNSDGSWTYSVIYQFVSAEFGDGQVPYGPLTIDASGNLYGTTLYGGLHNSGTVFRLSASGGTWTESILYHLPAKQNGGDAQPFGVVADNAGDLFGVAQSGFANLSNGTIFQLTPAAGSWVIAPVYNFAAPASGVGPSALAIDSSGTLNGTTGNGGNYGCGTVYKLQLINGKWKQIILHTFTCGSDGGYPAAGVILDPMGNVYGTTFDGGSHNLGTIFEITP